MKVVLFCGGMGTRLGNAMGNVPKPMVRIGYRPILWHVMKYYATFGHTDFILCLGYKADIIKEYFLSYNECISNDFTLSQGGKEIRMINSDIGDWRITFIDTGLRANIGQRMKAIESHIGQDEMFLANYADGLTDYPLPKMIEEFKASGKVASLLCVKPSQTFHIVSLDSDHGVRSIEYVSQSDLMINGGFFVFRKEIFQYLEDGEELVEEPFRRLIRDNKLLGIKHDRFWCMDTFKDQQELSDMAESGQAPWEIWRKPI